MPGKMKIDALKPWKELGVTPEAKAYSGTAEYTIDFTLENVDGNSFVMPAYDVWVRSLYSINMTLTVGEHGTATLSPEGPWYSGDTVTLTVIPEEGYRVKRIAGTTTEYVHEGNAYIFVLDNLPDRLISVEFEETPTAAAQPVTMTVLASQPMGNTA